MVHSPTEDSTTGSRKHRPTSYSLFIFSDSEAVVLTIYNLISRAGKF